MKKNEPTEQDPEKQITSAFEKLREVVGKYWDEVKCPCSEMCLNKCELNCPEYEE